MSDARIIVMATGNPGKLREMSDLLAGLKMEVRSQSDFDTPEAEETGLTFVENAILKARNACAHSGYPAIADDSGIEVDALNGEPGIYSARFAGAGASDEENNAELLSRLRGLPFEKCTARYRCCMVYLRHAGDPSPLIAEGSWEGIITPEPRGNGGFGYDPYFFLPKRGITAAELPADEKNRISHRALAMRALLSQMSRPE